MATIQFFNVIDRPMHVVQSALLESFSTYQDLGHLTAVTHSIETFYHSANFNYVPWPKQITHVSLKIQLSGRTTIGNHTFLHSSITYTYKVKYSVLRSIYSAFIKQRIKREALARLHQFKYRIEKWL